MTDRELLVAISENPFSLYFEEFSKPVILAIIKAHLANDVDTEKFMELVIKSHKDYSNMRKEDWDLIDIMEQKYS